jgi:hypothetical protein
MKSMLVSAAAMLAVIGLSSGPSQAADCGLLGVVTGCATGRHEADRRDQDRGRSDRGWDHDRVRSDRDHDRGNNTNGYGSSMERGSGSGYGR